MNPHFNNAGAQFATKRQIAPAVYVPGNTLGAGIDKLAIGNPQSCKMVVDVGAVTGSSGAVVLEDSADNSTFAQYVPPRGPTGTTPGVAADAQINALTVAATLTEKNVDLSSSRRYIRLNSTVTGGTSMAIEAHLVVAGGDTMPQA